MKIKINNYVNFEKVISKVVVIRGYIDSSDGISGKDIEVAVTESKDNVSSIGYIRLINNCFSVIVRLCLGRNTITFKWKDEIVKVIHILMDPNIQLNHLNSKYKVKPLIVLSLYAEKCQLVEFDSIQESYFSKIQTGLELLQWYFSEKLFEGGFSRRSFNICSSSNFYISIPPSKIIDMESNELWEILAREISNDEDLWDEDFKYIAFIIHPWKHNMRSNTSSFEPMSAVAGGGLALLDYKLLNSWPETYENVFLTLESELHASDETGFRTFISTVGRVFGASLGVVAHEMGHVFGLGHMEDGLMGKDFHRFALTLQPKIKSVLGPKSKKIYTASGDVYNDPVQLSLSSITMLFYNRWFNSSQSSSESDLQISISKNIISSLMAISVIEVRDPVSGLVLSCWTNDPERPRTNFVLSKRLIPVGYRNTMVEIIVQNVSSALMKFNIQICDLPGDAITSLKLRTD